MRESLLRIDVKSEIRKLCGRRFKSPGEYAVELVRDAASRKPTRIEISVGHRSLVVSHDGICPGNDTLGDLEVLFDPTRPDPQRHDALVTLESREGLGILSAFAVPGASVTLETGSGELARRIEFSAGGTKRLKPPVDNRFCIRVRGKKRKPRSERSMLTDACRYATIPILLNGKIISGQTNVPDCLMQTSVRNKRLIATIGIPEEGELTRIVRLKNGILLRDMLRPSSGGLVFHAIAEETDDDLDATWGTLRQSAKHLYSRLSDRYEELGDTGQPRAARLLFERHRRSPGDHLLDGVRVFQMTGVGRVTVDRVAELSSRGPVYAVGSEQPLHKYETEGRHVLRLDSEQRRFLAEEMDISPRTPPRRRSLFGGVRALKRLVQQLPTMAGSLFYASAGTPVDPNHLTPNELRFLKAATRALHSGDILLPSVEKPDQVRLAMTDGQRRPWVRKITDTGTTNYYISRSNNSVRAVIDKFCADGSMLPPALAFLSDGQANIFLPQ